MMLSTVGCSLVVRSFFLGCSLVVTAPIPYPHTLLVRPLDDESASSKIFVMKLWNFDTFMHILMNISNLQSFTKVPKFQSVTLLFYNCHDSLC